MQVTETASEGLKREYKVVVAADDMTSRIDERLAELQRTAQIRGFRRGKAPVGLLRRQFGDAVVSEVVQQTLKDTSDKVISEQGVRPAVAPRIEDMSFDEGADLEYVIALEVAPEIQPDDFSSYELEKATVAVSDEDVDKVLEDMRARNRVYEEADGDRAAERGDMAVVDFTGAIDGEAFAGGSAEGQTIEVGAGRLLPDLEVSLEGRKAGDDYTVDVAFPERYAASHLAGKTASFSVQVKSVSAGRLPALDDAFAAGQGHETLDELRQGVRDRLQEQSDGIARQRLKRLLLDKLAENHDFDVPPSLVDREFEAIWSRIAADHADDTPDSGAEGGDNGTGADDDKAAKRAEAEAEYRAIAARRVRLAMLLGEVAREHGIEVREEDVRNALTERARQFPGQEARVVQYYQDNPQALQALTAPVIEDRVVDRILSEAKVTERSVTREEFVALENAAAEGRSRRRRDRRCGRRLSPAAAGGTGEAPPE